MSDAGRRSAAIGVLDKVAVTSSSTAFYLALQTAVLGVVGTAVTVLGVLLAASG